MRDNRLLFGPLAAVLLLVGIIGLAFLVPDYNAIRQTVSEIGEMDSPARIPFAVMLCLVAVCLIIFALAVRCECHRSGHNAFCAYLMVCMAVSGAGVGIFAFPHPLHNVFGLSETIGYQAPLAFALAWRRDAGARGLVIFSWIFFALIWLSIGFNMSSMIRGGSLWMHIKPYYGLVQRSLFAAWFLWCGGIGVLLWQRRPAA
jgi:hypothetical membrane protein